MIVSHLRTPRAQRCIRLYLTPFDAPRPHLGACTHVHDVLLSPLFAMWGHAILVRLRFCIISSFWGCRQQSTPTREHGNSLGP